MTPFDPNEHCPDVTPRVQFNLQSVIWLVTVVAIMCSIGASAVPIWKHLPHQELAATAFLFWPLAAIPLVITCPGATLFVRCILFAFCGVGTVLLSLALLYYHEGEPSFIFVTALGMLLVGPPVWVVEIVGLLGIIDYCKRRKIRK